MKASIWQFLVLCLSFAVVGCVAPSYKPSFSEQGVVPSDTALVVLTHGRKDKSRVFVSYDVVGISSEKGYQRAFLPAEKVRLYKPGGDLDKGYYGFMHVLELPEGAYYLTGRSDRGYDLVVPVGVIPVPIPSSNEETPIMLRVDLKGGKLNYLGEIVVLDKPLTNANIMLTNRWDRDAAMAEKMLQSLDGYEIYHVNPKKVDAVEF